MDFLFGALYSVTFVLKVDVFTFLVKTDKKTMIQNTSLSVLCFIASFPKYKH